MKRKLTVEDLLFEMDSILKFKRTDVTEKSLKNRIRVPDINRAGLAFAGYYDYFGADRIQVVGKTEMSFLSQLSESQRDIRIKKFMSYQSPLIIFTRNINVPSLFIEQAKKK